MSVEVESDGPIDLAQIVSAVQAVAGPPKINAMPAAAPPLNLPGPARPATPKAERRKRRLPKEIRDEVAQALLDGPLRRQALMERLGLSGGSLDRALRGSWFQKCDDGFELTPGGRVAAEVVKTT